MTKETIVIRALGSRELQSLPRDVPQGVRTFVKHLEGVVTPERQLCEPQFETI